MNRFIAALALFVVVPIAQAQQAPMLEENAASPVTTAYLLKPEADQTMRLYFGEAELQTDDKVAFEAMWEIAPTENGCAAPISDYAASDLLFSDIVMIGAPDAYASADDLVTRVTGTLVLAAGQHELELPEPLAECQARFLASYYTLKEQ